uniref:Huntingtin-interacting protein 1-related protein n=1 Tax=Cyprinus carpio TaxID=7962 RepID=A0A8C2KP01_CYPCA
MDRVKSSMQQVPNPIPKVLSRRTGGANSLEVEKENFERSQAVSINKAINTQEVAVKEKHARNILLFKGAHTFWLAVNRLPLSSNAVLCWKFCHVFHKLLRDGHPNVIKDSMRHKADLNDMSRMWGHLSEGYGKLCSIYLKLLITKMEFHIKVNTCVILLYEMMALFDVSFFTVFSSLDMSRSVSVTAAGQCRLAPLIQVILDSSHLYDYTVKLLFKLHSCLPADTLQGHRDRFQEQFKKLKSLFYRSSNLQYFKRLIQIPQLPENPPNFLRASALSEHISPVVVIPVESSSPESEHVVETEDLSTVDTKFDDLFGTSAATDPFNFNSQNGMRKDEKDRLIEQLTAELQAVKEDGRLCQALRGRVNELEAELAEQTHLKQQALGESEFLRAELDDLRRVKEDTEKEQRSLSEIERKAQANEQRYTKLKEKYTELVQSHADLLRKNAEVTRQMTVARAAQDEVENVKKEMQDRLKAAQDATSQQVGHKPHAYAHTLPLPDVTLVCLSYTSLSSCILHFMTFVDTQSIEMRGTHMFLTDFHVMCVVDVSGLVRAVTQFAHLVGDVIVQGSATSHMVPVEQADVCYGYMRHILAFGMYHPGIPCVFILHNAEIDVVCYFVFSEQKLRPRGLELQQGELGDLVEQEMAATSAAVESAAARIEEMLNKSRAVDTGIKMEVNERILASCTDLMQAIKVLVLSSKDLQRDIVESGRGAASMKEFYAKNSRWTEGLISASKAVGWGATIDAADQVVQGTGKFEELMVCSHEIAASTAQLVAASKVKADKDSPNLSRLRQASKGVTQATAGVVASTKSGKSQIEDTETMDFSAMTLTQIKRQEMDAQVLVLELETRLQKERERLGELRKKHYELAGVNGSGWDTT